MKIIFVSHKHAPGIGGMEVHNTRLYQYLCKNNEIIPIIKRQDESILIFILRFRSSIREVLKQHPDSDIIYTNDGLMALFVAPLKKEFKHLSFITTVHGLEAAFPSNIYQNKILPQLNYFDKIISVSSFTNSLLARNPYIQLEKLAVVKNGCDDITTQRVINIDYINKYKFLEGKKILLSVGRAVKRKGFAWFAKEVMPRLSQDYIYVIVGPTKKRSAISHILLSMCGERFTKYIDLIWGYPNDSEAITKVQNSNIIHLGSLPQSELDHIINMAHVAIIPNIEEEGDVEGFGLVALEFGCQGKQVIASNIQGLQDAIVHGKNGYLIKAADTKLWVKTILDIDKNAIPPSSVKQFIQEHYSWDRMGKSYLNIFEECANKQIITELSSLTN
jgi:phosphatidylinositol alpha-1,6-mannosyltransferase